MKTRALSTSLAAVLSVSVLAVQPVSAFTVIDPTNLVQNTLIAIRTLEQINNQVEQLQNESQMLINQARATWRAWTSTSSTGCARRWRGASN